VSRLALAPTRPADVAARVCTGLVWSAVVASALFWGSRLLATPSAAAADTSAASALQPVNDDFRRLLGAAEDTSPAAPEPAPAASRFVLNGVVASTEDHESGVALIAIDGQRPRAFRTGDAIDAGYRLDKVSHRSAVLVADDGMAPVVLEMATPEARLAMAQPQPQLQAPQTLAPLPAAPGPTAMVRPDATGPAAVPMVSSVTDPGTAPVPAVDLVQEASARPPGSTANTSSPGRRKRLRGLAR
jgi:general secretion pathway protein C